MKPQISVSDSITLVTLQNAPADMDFIATIFEKIAEKSVDVNMVSLSPVQGATTSVSFTINDDDLITILSYTSSLKSSKIKPIVSSGNSIISIFDENMEDTPGIAAKILRAVAGVNTDIRIVTTSEVQISLLVTDAAYEKAYVAIEKCLNAE
ncbi:MAG TPA: hypothetical protein GX401_04970 [Clostridiales bacterium]|nr:hypothetical protein [Clostridiales bacterium]